MNTDDLWGKGEARMTNQEAIDAIKMAISQVEWDYPMDYAAAFDKAIEALQAQEADESKYEYHIDHTNCPWYISGEASRCPVTCSQYRDGWNDAMNYIFRNGDGYRPYERIRKGR